MSTLWNVVRRMGALADRPTDGDDERQRHRFLLITGASMSFGGASSRSSTALARSRTATP